jgi:hypothetical protein
VRDREGLSRVQKYARDYQIIDVKSGEWGIGGQPLSTEGAKALAEGKTLG